MATLDGIEQIGSYSGTPSANLAEFLDLLGDPDEVRSDGRDAGSNLDEMSPIARAQLVVEATALSESLNLSADGVAYGTYTAIAADATANLVDIVTGLADTAVSKYAVTVWRAGVIVTADAVISEPSAGTLRVADGGVTYSVTADDIIVWFAIDPAA